MARLKKNRFEPDMSESITSTPSTNIDLFLTVSIRGKSHQNMVERIIKRNYDATIIDGPQDIIPGWKERLAVYLQDLWKETLAIFAGSLGAVHVTMIIIVGTEHFTMENLSYVHYIELILISGVPSVVHLLTSHRKYERNIE